MEHNIQNLFHFLSYFTPEKLPGFLFFPKIIFGSVGIFFLFFVGFVLIKSSYLHYLIITDLKEFFTYRALGMGRFTKEWQALLLRLETGRQEEYKLALIEADTMLDQTMKRVGYAGETLNEKLQKISLVILPNAKEVQEVHAMRDTIVHDPNFVLTLDQAKRAMNVYQKAFEDLDLI